MSFLKNLIGAVIGKTTKVQSQSISRRNLDEMTAKAYGLVGAMNQSLKEANTSNNIQLREGNLLEVKSKLKVLKDICSKYPAIYITALDEFETSIEKVEAETLNMKKGLQPQSNTFNKSTGSDVDKHAILESINSHFRVINESIDIARKSKNLDTTESRLQVARDTLNRAKEIANQFSLNIDGFNEAEAEINRITEAVIAGTPKIFDGMREIQQDPMYSTPSRNLLKEATLLKKEKKYFEACSKLREAYLSDGAEMLMIEERLRLPMYLQLAGKNDEGWIELNRLLKKYNDHFSNQIILKQMQIFLKKENNISAKNPLRIIELVDIAKPSSDNNQSNKPFLISSGDPEKAWRDNQEVARGLEFCATMQIRTPLRVLKRHGEIHSDINLKPEKIVKEEWEGTWIVNTANWREIGFDIDELEESVMSSNIGPIRASEYLPFLISLREIVEADELIDSRINMMRKKPMTGIWKTYVVKHGGIDEIINQFFPRFIDTIPKLNKTTIDELSRLGIVTANKLEAASDSSLMSINGIGKAKLKSMRDYCASITKNRDDDRLDNVTR